MSDFQQGPGWWYASDGKWYPPPAPMQPPVYRQWQQPQRQRVPTERIARGMMIGWAVGASIGLLLAVVFAVWVASQIEP